MLRKRAFLTVVLLASSSLLYGCATLPPGSVRSQSDPFERFNRSTYAFNDTVDRALLKPVAQAYKKITPHFVQEGITNAFGNISDLPTAVNDALQGKPTLAVRHVARFVVNSTVGVLGLFDVATKMGMDREREDFGQTLGVWGLRSGPYIVLPLLGSSSVRDGLALVVDLKLDPLYYVDDSDWRLGLAGLRVIQQRASFLDIERTVESIEIDPYVFRRDFYLSRRRNAIVGGKDSSEPRKSEQSTEPEDAKEATASTRN
jgi:phospholipid-binding lipoprotein MlaA